MLTETGRVVAIEGDAAWIETLRQSACGKCTARSGCGHGMLNSAVPSSSRGLIRAYLAQDWLGKVRIHDTVELSLPEQNFLRAASLLYALPLLTTLLAAIGADQYLVSSAATVGSADLQVSLAACGGLAFGLLLLRGLSRRSERDPANLPRVTGKL